MKYYELTYLTLQDMSEEAAKQLLDKFSASITAKQGVVIDSPKAYKRRLAYPVKKQEVAFVNSMRFQMEPAPLLAFSDEVKKDNLILRSIIVSYVPQPIRQMPERIQEPQAETPAVKEQAPAVTPEVVVEINQEKVEEKKEEKKETNPAEKKVRRDKPKADLKEIGEKLDEILND